MDSAHDIYEFLSLPENIEVALDVAEHVTRLKEKAYTVFLDTFQIKMMQLFKERVNRETWKYEKVKIRSAGSWFIHAQINEIAYVEKYLCPVFGILQKDHFFWGIWRRELLSSDLENTHIDDLKLVLVENGIIKTDLPSCIYYGMYKRYRIHSAEFIQAIFHDGERIVSEIAEDFIHLFLECKPTLEVVNREINQPE